MGASSSEGELRNFTTARLRLARASVEGGDSLAATFPATTELAAEAMRVERCGIWLFVQERRAIRCFDVFERSRASHSEGTILHAQDFPAYFAALEEMRVVQADDAHKQPLTSELEAAYLTPLGIGSMLDAPVFRNGQVVGVVCHEHVGTAREWTSKEVDFASSVSDSVALQIEAAALRDVEATLRAREAQLSELRKWEAMGSLARGVAHDFRNVLVGVMAHAAVIIRDRRAHADLVEDGRAILTLAEQGAELAKDLMMLGNTEPHAPRVLDLTGAVAGSAPMLRSILRGTSCDLRMEVDHGTRGRVFMDRTDVRRLLFNLVVNSRDAMRAEGTVEVRVQEASVAAEDGEPAVYVVLSVSDTGAGMEASVLSHALEPFFTTKANGKGTGLGLSIVRTIVERTGGFVRIESTPGVGTSVRAYIPRITCDARTGPCAGDGA
jgi:two-component system, cell cycle sensor histidine kinase and response regulator CckA